MISQLEKEVVVRYLKARKKERFLNLISIFSFVGISLGVAVLIIVMSVMNGFRTELIEKIVGFNAHAIIKPYENAISQKKIQKLSSKKISDQVIQSNSGEGVLIHKGYTKGLLLRGYLENEFLNLKITKNNNFIGEKKLNPKFISIGNELSLDLNIDIGDKVLIMSPSGIQTIVGTLPKQETYIVQSIFDSGLADFNQNIAFLNIYDLENLFELDKTKRFYEIYLKNPKNIEDTKKILQDIFKNEFVYTWSDLNRPLFSALKVERNVMFIILSLIIVVAAFNIISGLTILVKNKTREIGILKSIGVQNKSIKKIFFLVGFSIGTTATFFGILIGILFSYYIEGIRKFFSNFFNLNLFPEEIYFLSKMPSEININYIILIGISSIAITSIVSIFPAIKASNLDPVQSLKYE